MQSQARKFTRFRVAIDWSEAKGFDARNLCVRVLLLQEKPGYRALSCNECVQVGIDLIFMGRAHAVRCVFINFQRSTFDDFG
jgi:hypothetical protein